MGGLLLFAQLACKGPCGEQKGKALSGATNGSVVANPSLSAENESPNKEILNYQLVKDFFFYTTYSSNDGFDVIICDQFGFQFATISS